MLACIPSDVAAVVHACCHKSVQGWGRAKVNRYLKGGRGNEGKGSGYQFQTILCHYRFWGLKMQMQK